MELNQDGPDCCNPVRSQNGREGSWLNVTTPAGYTGWVARSHVEIFDGPSVEEATKPDPRRERFVRIRAELDALEAAL